MGYCYDAYVPRQELRRSRRVSGLAHLNLDNS
jgi:hypothetical protein